MPRYITVPFETDPEDLQDKAIAFLQDNIDGWEPADGNLDLWLIQAVSSEAAEVMDVASAVPAAIFRVFGAELMGLPPIEAAPAYTYTTWTMIDNGGHTIPAGTQVGIQAPGDVTIAFETQADVVVPPGSTSTATGGVLIMAIDPGAAGTALGGPGATVDLIDPLAFVNTITMTQATAGGVDREDDDVYLDRLATKLRTMTPRPILPNDFAILAKDIAGVYRAVAIDMYNPADNSYGNERMVTVAAMDSAGADVSTTTNAQIQDYLDRMREVNFVVNVMNPKRTAIDVSYTVCVLPGFDGNQVVSDVNASISDFFSPVNWGYEPTVTPDPLTWIDSNTIRYNEVIALIDRQEGVKYVQGVLLNNGTSDVAMAAPASLPAIDDVSGSFIAST